MGGGDIPQLQMAQQASADQYGLNNIQGGAGLLSDLQARKNQGLDQNTIDQWRQWNELNNTRTQIQARRGMKDATAGRQLTTGALVNPMANLYGDLALQTAGVNKDISLADQQAKQQNFGMYAQMIPQLSQTGYNIGAGKYGQYLQGLGLNNQAIQGQYDMNKQGQFDWGGLLGNLFGLGGQLGSAALMRH